uniref:cytochrome ubiquinol oxidase subunit I n=1 Tax=Chitinimonas sp. TaxID=1934313 RepID=UPI0035B15D0A
IRSFAVAAGFGLASALSVIILGDESGYTTGEVQKVKLAAIEAEWETHPAPAGITVFGLPNQEQERTDYAVKIPYVLGLIATRSTDTPVIGIKDLKKSHEWRIRSGMEAYGALSRIKAGDTSDATRLQFEQHKADLGYGLLVKPYAPNVVDASAADIARAVNDTIPKVAPLFWAFRGMVALGIGFLFIFAASFWFLVRKQLAPQRWLLRLCVLAIPLPWVAIELGWFVAEYGRQPWAISGILPTRLAASSVAPSQVWGSLITICSIYLALFAVELFLMIKTIRKGPASLATGRYHGETANLVALEANHA